MGGLFSSSSYNLDDHGHSDRQLYDDYVASPDKFNDLTGKVVAVTGTSTGGMGFYACEVAIKKNAKVLLLLNRDSSSAKKGEEGLKAIVEEIKAPTKIQSITCDMQDMEVVKKAGEEVNKVADKNGGLDILICNSGIMATRDKRSKDGYEVQMQTNQLSHFLLTSIVFPSLVKASESRGEARFVTHSSSARHGKPLEEKYFLKCGANTLGGDDTWTLSELMLGSEGPWTRYHMSKLANSVFAMAMHKKCQEKGLKIKALTADPGVASSNLQVSSTKGDGLMSGWFAKTLMGSGHSAPDGSLDISMCAFSPDAKSGDMYAPENGFKGAPKKTIEEGKEVKKGSETATTLEANQTNVWKWCEEGLGIKFDV